MADITKASRHSEVLIVTARNFHGIARLPRLLNLAGCRVSSLAPAGAVLASSSFVSERYPGSDDANDALDRLRRLLDGKRYDWIIFGDDLILDHAVRRRGEPWLGGLLPVRGGEAEALISKIAFSRAMGAAGVPMAPAGAASDGARVREAARELGFPVIVKPERGFSGKGLFSARSSEELEKGLQSADGEYIVESLIEGRMGATPVIFNQGRPAWWSSFINEGVWPPPFGPSCRRLAFEPDGLEPVLERIGAALGLHGLMGIDWLLTPEGKLFVIELNGRPIQMAGTSPHVSEGLPAALGDFLEGRFVVRRPSQDPAPEVLHAMPASFLLALSEGHLSQAAGLLLGLSGRTDVPWTDPGLLKNHSIGMTKTLIKAVVNRAREACRRRKPA